MTSQPLHNTPTCTEAAVINSSCCQRIAGCGDGGADAGRPKWYDDAMKRRWFIRSFFILPILLCFVGWGWSVGHRTSVIRTFGSHLITFETETGYVSVEDEAFPDTGTRWLHATVEVEPNIYELRGIVPPQHVICELGYFGQADLRIIYVPYWFLIVLLSSVLFLVWRRTHPKPKGGAFPVDVKANGTA